MQEWSAEQVTKITQELTNLEFLPAATNVDRGVLNQEFVLQQMDTALMALTSYEANDTVTNSRKNPLEAWRRLQKRYDPTTGGRKRHLLRAIISLGRCSLSELQAGIERWESYLSRLEKKLKDTFDDEIKLAGLEALVLEELPGTSLHPVSSRRHCCKAVMWYVHHLPESTKEVIRDRASLPSRRFATISHWRSPMTSMPKSSSLWRKHSAELVILSSLHTEIALPMNWEGGTA